MGLAFVVAMIYRRDMKQMHSLPPYAGPDVARATFAERSAVLSWNAGFVIGYVE